MARRVNDVNDLSEIMKAVSICRGIINDILEYDVSMLNHDDVLIFKKAKEDVKGYIEVFDSSIDYRTIINKELLSNENVEYAFKHGKFPENASFTAIKLLKSVNHIFEIEDELAPIVARAWKNIVTPFDKIINGEKFTFIGHSGSGYIILPSSRYYRNNDYNNISSISCSIFTENCMNCFSSNLVMLFDVDEDSYISASSLDSATRAVSSYSSVLTLKVNSKGIPIDVGFLYMSDDVVTRIKSEKKILEEIKGSRNINEVVLDKELAKASGLVLFSSGYDFQISLYVEAMIMKSEYGIPFKVINKNLYGLSNDNINNLNEYLKNNDYLYSLANQLEYNEFVSILDGYIEDVIIPLKLDKEVESLQIDYINKIKEKVKPNSL